MVRYEPIIGLEVHVQLKTKSKMFCRCSSDIWTESPNTHTCPICLGLPGALPFPNRDAIEKAVKVGLVLNCQPIDQSKFDRKNYFYPDLPKGFQISQYDLPFSQNGWVEIETRDKRQETRKKILIIRAHLEEDTGKLIHTKVNGNPSTLIDFNRSGIPLMEIVSAPDLTSAQEAKNYAAKIQQIVRYLGVSDADMEKGSMRVEPNVSLKPAGSKKLPPYKVELKNINSFRSVGQAIDFEIKRQTEILEKGEQPIQETRGWDEIKQKTYTQRIKEEAFDYRYFPEPDLPPVNLSKLLITTLKSQFPELPDFKKKRFIEKLGISSADAEILTKDLNLSNFFEEAVAAFAQTRVRGTKAKPTTEDSQKIANWIKGEVLRNLNELGKNISEVAITPAGLAEIVYLVENGTLTAQSGKIVLAKWMQEGVKPAKLIETLKVGEITSRELEKIIKKVIWQNQKAVKDFTSGKEAAFSFLVGQVQKEIGGKAQVTDIKDLLLANLKPSKNQLSKTFEPKTSLK